MKEKLEPPAALLLVHGAGSGPSIYDDWPASFPRMEVRAVDLHEGLDVARASMDDYARNVVAAAAQLPPPVSLCGWSMGGLVVLQAAAEVSPHSVILLESSPPAEVQGFHLEMLPQDGLVDIEEIFGSFPAGIRARPESLLARMERHRGIAVPTLPCPSLVVYTNAYREDRGRAIARLYDSEERYFPDLGHWGLVLDPRVRTEIAGFLGLLASNTTEAKTAGAWRPGVTAGARRAVAAPGPVDGPGTPERQ